MDTRAKSNAEFRNEVSEILARHESNFDQIHGTLQTVLTELQSLRISQSTAPVDNPFAQTETSQNRLLPATNNNPDRNHTNLKLSFPNFTGDDPTGWIYRAEQYFEFQSIASGQRVQLASFHLEGIALQWHRWFTKFSGPVDRGELTTALLRRFGPTDFDDPSEALTRLKHTTTVATYQEEFERLSQRIDALPDSHLIGCFIAGLKDDVRLDVKLKKPRTLSETIGVARLVEERNTIQKKTNIFPRPIVATNTPPNPNPVNATTASLLGPPPTQKPNPYPSPPQTHTFKKITAPEARVRREKGLCYYCDEKYVPGHRCTTPQLFMIGDVLTAEDQTEPPIIALTTEDDPPTYDQAVAQFHPCGQG